tara:strand:+ start:3897 stop:5804 length:1908 start_codon:yes stop_codon:yes gene_type:complete
MPSLRKIWKHSYDTAYAISVTTVNKLKESIVFTLFSFIFVKKPIIFASKKTIPVVYLLGPKSSALMSMTFLFYRLKNLFGKLYFLRNVCNGLCYKTELRGGTKGNKHNEHECVNGGHNSLALHLLVSGETEIKVEPNARDDVAVNEINHEIGLKEVVEKYDRKNKHNVSRVHSDIVFYTWKKMLPIHLILATDENYGIGKNGEIPWDSDLGYFKKITTTTQDHKKKNALVMGRLTYNSMPISRISLSRKCVVVTSSELVPFATSTRSLRDAISECQNDNSIENIFIVGGSMMYKEALDLGFVDHIYLTRVLGLYDCDVSVPWLKNILCRYYKMSFIRQANRFTYEVYSQNGESEYINLMQDIIENGEERPNRTGVDTSSIFGRTIRFPFKDGFPLLTTKRVFWKGVIEELLWFLRGDTSSSRLSEKGVRIWEGNTSKEYMETRGLGYNEGDCGPVYGYQWRHWNAEYGNCDDSYKGKGIDQIAQVIDSIKNDPYSRRHIISAWNVGQLDEMVLPPCHVLCQFFVSKNGDLSCQMYQRSADMFLGVPFNIASYAALTYIIARETGLQPKELIMCFGDAHIYSNHMVAVEEQLKREQRKFPTLRISSEAGSYDTLTMDDFIIEGYNPHATIKASMAV